MTPIIESLVENSVTTTIKDPRWLQVEVCREFQRGKCTRSDTECRFAHPDETIQIENGGKVTACFDSMKERCERESCKYFHPPHHIKLQLEANGRLLKLHKQQLQAFASKQMIQTPATVLPLPVNTLGAFPVTFVSSPVLTTSPQSMPVATTNSNWRTEKIMPFLEVCQDYIKGICSSSECECLSAHPGIDVLHDNSQKRITVCMDFVKGRCTRESCRYFHPPLHLQNKLKTVKISQSQLSPMLASSRKRLGDSTNNLVEDQGKKQALNYTLINTPLALPANFATIVQPSAFQSTTFQPTTFQPTTFQPTTFQSTAFQSTAFQPTTNTMQFAPAFFSTVPLSVPQFASTTTTVPYVHPQLQQLSALNNNYKHIQLPICRDYKAGNCRRDPCKYIHLDNRNVEVVDGKVTICLDATKGKCQRTECKYHHLSQTSDNKTDGR